jgi:hypothetical protein
MKINHIYSKSVTCLEEGEVVAERYNGSNASFAIFKTTELSNGGVVGFESLKDFEYIDWGDGNITFGPIKNAAAHAYSEFEGKKAFTIVVYGIKDFGSGKTSSNLFSYDNIKEAYFGDGVKIWSDRNNGGFKNCCKTSLEAIKNISYIPSAFCSGVKNLKEITFSIDCREIKVSAFSDTCTTEEKCLVIPKYITMIRTGAFTGSGFKVCIEYTSPATKPSGYSDDIGTDYYYYSETEPTEVGNYWHYVNGEPTIWGEAIMTIDGVSYYFKNGMTWGEWCNNSDYNTLGLSVDTENNYVVSSAGKVLLKGDPGTPDSPNNKIDENGRYTFSK